MSPSGAVCSRLISAKPMDLAPRRPPLPQSVAREEQRCISKARGVTSPSAVANACGFKAETTLVILLGFPRWCALLTDSVHPS